MNSPDPAPSGRVRRQYSFGDFTLDLDGGFLRRRGEEVSLRPKPFEVLVYLVEHHGRVVAKGELIEAVWPGTAVMDNSLAQCLVEIRRVLADESQQVVRTVARRGYVFSAPVTVPVVEFRPLAASAEARGPQAALPKANPGVLPAPHVIAGALAVVAVLAVALLWVRMGRNDERLPVYAQLTNFTDSVMSPALSADGRMLAFIRSDNWFLTPGQIYVKLLPDGEPIQITHDQRPKYGLAFSPDGSRVVYTVAGPWSTYSVSSLGGEPTLLLANSSGVTWLDQRRLLFSEVDPPNSTRMGLVTAMDDRSEKRPVYFPQDERGMVHLSYASPDDRWALVLEMNPAWQPCRVVPMDGSSAGRQVGPKGSCTSAGWSPDGTWMYFGANVDGARHLWRQRFPDGRPEQITSGPTEEDGVAVAPDGGSLITSIGVRQSALWLHDPRGDRALTSQGYVSHPEWSGLQGTIPVFSRDGRSLFYLRSESPGAPPELWRADLASEKSEKVLPGVFMVEFDLSDDAQEVLYSLQPAGKPSQLWIARLDRRLPPEMIVSSGGDSPYFGPDRRIVYRSFDGTRYYLQQIDRDGGRRSNIAPLAVGNILSMTPDRRWITTVTTIPDIGAGTFAVPLDGGPPRRICAGCPVAWSLDAKVLYLFVRKSSLTDPGKMRVVPLPPGDILPPLPPSGLTAPDESEPVPGSLFIDRYGISPGVDASVYAYVKTTMHRNLFQIPLR